MNKNGNNPIIVDGVLVLEHYDINGLVSGKSIMDIEDAGLLGDWTWSLGNGYVFRGRYKEKNVYLHREIINAPTGFEVDHINRIMTDNRKSNLRIVSGEENRKNKSTYSTSTTGVSGVHYRAKIDKYEVVLSINNKKIYCGRYNSLVEAIAERQARP